MEARLCEADPAPRQTCAPELNMTICCQCSHLCPSNNTAYTVQCLEGFILKTRCIVGPVCHCCREFILSIWGPPGLYDFCPGCHLHGRCDCKFSSDLMVYGAKFVSQIHNIFGKVLCADTTNHILSFAYGPCLDRAVRIHRRVRPKAIRMGSRFTDFWTHAWSIKCMPNDTPAPAKLAAILLLINRGHEIERDMIRYFNKEPAMYDEGIFWASGVPQECIQQMRLPPAERLNIGYFVCRALSRHMFVCA